MTQTSVELRSPRIVEIRENADDTPRSVVGVRGIRGQVLLASASTTQILNPAYSGMNDFILISRDMTGHSEEEVVQESEFVSGEEAPAHEEPRMSDAEIANRDRLELLARAYVAGQLSPEEEARLAIVSERVRRLIPRVTVEDFEELGRLAEEIKSIESEDVQRRTRLDLP